MSKKIKCINPKTYSLTRNKEYDVLSEGDSNYRIYNDRGLEANYNSKLFEEVVSELSDSEIVSSYRVVFGGENDEGDVHDSTITFKNRIGKDIVFTITTTEREGNGAVAITNGVSENRIYALIGESVVSCGITTIDGIDSLSEEITTIVDALAIDTWPEGSGQQDFINQIFIDVIKCIANNHVYNSAFLLLSTAIENNNILSGTPDLLSQYASQESKGMNPNSGNEITVWLIPIEAFNA